LITAESSLPPWPPVPPRSLPNQVARADAAARTQPGRAVADNDHCRIKMARRRRQLDLPTPSTWGGRRPGAGRKLVHARPGPPHAPRPAHDGRFPVHVTLRARPGVPSLRSTVVFCELGCALAESNRRSLRVTQFSVQTDHLHLIVEADTAPALMRGLQGLTVRCARAVNRACRRRGPVWRERYHARALRTPREVRLALVYVLLNFRKHLGAHAGIDPRSSGPWFEGWAQPPPRPAAACPVASPRTWLGTTGWRRAGGPIDCREAPAPPSIHRAPVDYRPEFPDRP
jgi:putative transposase